jgi:hypothetical protein
VSFLRSFLHVGRCFTTSVRCGSMVSGSRSTQLFEATAACASAKTPRLGAREDLTATRKERPKTAHSGRYPGPAVESRCPPSEPARPSGWASTGGGDQTPPPWRRSQACWARTIRWSSPGVTTRRTSERCASRRQSARRSPDAGGCRTLVSPAPRVAVPPNCALIIIEVAISLYSHHIDANLRRYQ